MFGAFRILLAYLVVISHLMGSEYLAHFGFYAVRGFFVLSGFIMTGALHDVYGFDGVRYWANRLMRLLPPYYVVLAATLSIIALYPREAGTFLSTWRPAAQEHDVVMNLLVMPLQFGEPPFRALPPYWSIAVELEMYFLLWLVIARRESFAAIALIAGAVFHLACLADGLGWNVRYFSAPSAVLSFALGALIYFWQKRGVLRLNAWIALPASLLWTGNMIAGGLLLSDSYAYGMGYYLNLVLVAVIVAALAGVKVDARLHAIDRWLGELAYPVFLVQWVVGFAVALMFFSHTSRGLTLTLLSSPAIFLAAMGLSALNRVVVEPLRRRIRQGLIVPAPTARLTPAE